jgi:hypothetical protein
MSELSDFDVEYRAEQDALERERDQQAQELTGENAAIEAVARRLYLILPARDRFVEWDEMGRSGKKKWREVAIEIRALWNILDPSGPVQVERPDDSRPGVQMMERVLAQTGICPVCRHKSASFPVLRGDAADGQRSDSSPGAEPSTTPSRPADEGITEANGRVWVVESGEYEQRSVDLVAATVGDAVAAVKERYSDPHYVIAWHEPVQYHQARNGRHVKLAPGDPRWNDKNGVELTADFEHRTGWSTEHTASWSIRPYVLAARPTPSATERAPTV